MNKTIKIIFKTKSEIDQVLTNMYRDEIILNLDGVKRYSVVLIDDERIIAVDNGNHHFNNDHIDGFIDYEKGIIYNFLIKKEKSKVSESYYISDYTPCCVI